ncbi:MAG: hypothetical protein QXX69_03605 [Sulfolobales archaeon]
MSKLAKAVYEVLNILYDHLECPESGIEDCETLEELIEVMEDA